MKTINKILMTLMISFSFVSITAQTNELILEDYSSIKVNNVLFKEIQNTYGDITLMQNLFGNTFTVKSGYDDAIDNWITFSTNSLHIEFWQGIDSGLGMKYDLAKIRIKNNSSNFTIKNQVVTIGNSINSFGNINILTYDNGTKKIIFSGNDEYFSIKFNLSTSIITEIIYNGNLL